MKHFFCCLTLSALSALGAVAGGSGAPLRIYTGFQQRPAPAVDSAVQSELASLVSPIGLNVEWRSLSAPAFGETSAALVVVTFLGECNTAGLSPRGMTVGPLAWTHISDGAILPFVDVDCGRLRGFLQGKLLGTDAKERERLFGRAIARVLGHELYHVFAETRHHDKSGLAQTAFSSVDLLSDDFDFCEQEFRVLRVSKLRSLLSFRMPASQSFSGREEYEAEGCGACHGSKGEGTRLAPSLRLAKTLDPQTLASHFDKKREDMYRRARALKLAWQFPTDEEVAQLVAMLETGFE